MDREADRLLGAVNGLHCEGFGLCLIGPQVLRQTVVHCVGVGAVSRQGERAEISLSRYHRRLKSGLAPVWIRDRKRARRCQRGGGLVLRHGRIVARIRWRANHRWVVLNFIWARERKDRLSAFLIVQVCTHGSAGKKRVDLFLRRQA